tara:strand:- start:33 stop:482 length:450 start_codon:yes stop_codon:yes gene_type:complete
MSNSKNFANILKNIEISEQKAESESSRLLKNGWTIIKKVNNKVIKINPNNKKCLLNDKNKDKDINQVMSRNQWDNLINKMSANWDNFRDTQNYLYGDRSFYINYKEELEKLVLEDNYIFETIYKINNETYSDNDSDYNSDDESNKYLFY